MEHIKFSGKAYESMLARRSHNYADIESMLEIVEKFIIDNSLVLYGGMALDLAARLRGEFIYDDKDKVIPDYDFYSPDPINHAYQLAEIFYKKGYKTVNAINGMHVTTMRVRLDNDVVADISYMPRAIFETLPTLKAGKLKIVHPLYQRMDQHKALTEPMRDPPREPIFHRFKKDMSRFKIADRLYPISEFLNPSENAKNIKNSDIIRKKLILPKFKDIAFVGYVSYAVHYKQLADLMDDKNIEIDINQRKKFKEIIPIIINVDKMDVYIEIPENECIAFWTDNIEELSKQVQKMNPKSKATKRHVYMDKICPYAIKINNYDIFDNRGGLRPIFEYQLGSAKFDVCTGQSTLLYFMHLYMSSLALTNVSADVSIKNTKERQNPHYLAMYKSTMDIIELMEDILIENFGDDDIAKFGGIEKYSIFLTTNLFGTDNHGEAYEIAAKYNKYSIENTPFDQREQLRPTSYYPERKPEPPTAPDVTKLHYFQIDGLPVL